jgi:hypothetical protein
MENIARQQRTQAESLCYATLVFRTIERSFRTTLKVIAVNPPNPWPEMAKLAWPRVYSGLVENKCFALKGLETHAIRFKGSEPIIAVSPWATLFRPLWATDWPDNRRGTNQPRSDPL